MEIGEAERCVRIEALKAPKTRVPRKVGCGTVDP